MSDWHWQRSDRRAALQWIALQWPGVRPCLSSAPLNGGWVQARGAFNLRVDAQRECRLPPEKTLADAALNEGLTGTQVGLMTAASMNSFRRRTALIDGYRFDLGVTCGLSNALCAGDPAEWSQRNTRSSELAPEPGTINTILITDATLRPEAFAELLMLITEARTVALSRAGVRSMCSDQIATGTGTDASVIVGGGRESQSELRWCGKHTQVGSGVARLMIDALSDSLLRKAPVS